MKIAREGLREILLATVFLGGLAAASVWAAITISLAFLAITVACADLLILTILFFRDPQRTIPQEPGVLVSPADGKVTEVTRLDHYEGISGPAQRISIFLSVFDVHINRVPCDGRVKQTQYKPGEFLDARHAECGTRNEANTIVIEPTGSTAGPIIVRQVAGLIARRIICNIKENDGVQRGQRLGLIKFGSRTDLIVPVAAGFEPCVKVNDVVRGGSSILFRASNTADVRQSGGAGAPRQRVAAQA